MAVARLTALRWREGAITGPAGGLSGDQAPLACPGDGLGAVGRAEFAEDVPDVFFGRVESDHELVNLVSGLPGGPPGRCGAAVPGGPQVGSRARGGSRCRRE